MKTTVEIPDELLKAARKTAIDEGISFRELLEDALQHRLVLHRSQVAARAWGGPDSSREDLYASDSWKVLDDIERAFRKTERKRVAP